MGVGTRVYFLLHKQMLHIFFPNYMLWPISQIAMENYNHRFKVRLDQSPFLKFRQASNKYKNYRRFKARCHVEDGTDIIRLFTW